MEESSSGKVTPEVNGECEGSEEKPAETQEIGEVCREEISESPRATPTHAVVVAQEDEEQNPDDVKTVNEAVNQRDVQDQHNSEMFQLLETIKQLRVELEQKDSTIKLNERERSILEKEKTSLKREYELGRKEKESVVIKFAIKEKSLLDAKKETESAQKQLSDTKKELKNLTTKFQALNEEKSKVTHMVDEKCSEVKRLQKELEKAKWDVGNLETKLKWNNVKLNQETEAKLEFEKMLEEARALPKQIEEDKALKEKTKKENQANVILLKHDLEKSEQIVESLRKELQDSEDKFSKLDSEFRILLEEKDELSSRFEKIQEENSTAQNSLSQELLNSAKLRGQLDELKVLQTQNSLNEEKLRDYAVQVEKLENTILDLESTSNGLKEKESELLTFNKDMSGMIVDLQNQIDFEKAKSTALSAESGILKKERLDFDTKYNALETKFNEEVKQKTEERQLLTKHISEKTKLYEITKTKFENALGDLDAAKKKHSQVVKELNRELQKLKRLDDNRSRNSSQSLENSKHVTNSDSESSSDVVSSSAPTPPPPLDTIIQEPSKQHLIDRILRLQKAAVRQTEKIDFLENHTMSLVAELQKKSKLVQYYMIRDQTGALTSMKSDQHKSELAKYGSGVMNAIYNGVKGPNVSSNTPMTLDLSLEINRKLQAVLEDTLLKNITLKENLDVLGLEVDKLTRRLAKQG
ncbi:CCDC186 family protein [Megaselia abdita]